MVQERKKIKPNTEDEYKNVLASDPTKISKETQEMFALEAIKKFKSL
jgi:hypothetical protein